MNNKNTRDAGTVIRVGIDLALEPPKAFDVLLEELAAALARMGIGFKPGANGRVTQGEFEAGRIVSWKPGKKILLQWRQAEWEPDEITEVELQFQPINGGTRVTLEHREWGRLIDNPEELTGWFAGEVAAPFLRVITPAAFGDWLTDRRARRPSGAQARAFYRDPLYHYPGFRVILTELTLTPDDFLLEVGCGGGALLKEALKSGCRAAAIDHSAEMVQLARAENRDAVAKGRLEVRQASADCLPFPDETFTCAAMAGVLGFLPNPVEALGEIRRALRKGGRLVVLGSDARLRGTPAAPEPMASRLHFYAADELERLAREAGFEEVRVVRRDIEQFAREAGIPEEHLPLFAGSGEQFLLARRG